MTDGKITEEVSVALKKGSIWTFLDKAIYRLNREASRICSFLLILIALFVLVTVIGRFTGFPVAALFSVTIISLIIFGFLSLGHTLGEGKHVTVDFVLEHLPKNTRISLELLGYVFMVFFSSILAWQGTKWAGQLFTRGTSTAGSHALGEVSMPYWILPALMVVGCSLLILQAIRLFVKRSNSLQGIFSFRNCIIPVLLTVVFFAAGVLIAVFINPIFGIFVALLVMLLAGQPVAIALGTTGIIGLYFFAGGNSGLLQVPLLAFRMVESYPLVSLPLFIIIGTLMGEGLVIDKLFHFLDHWMGRIKGSLLMVTIATGAVICAITGSSVAATAVLSLICLPPLLRRKFDKRLSCGVVAAGSVGTLIPPSVGLIVYGVLIEESIGELFMAALIPAALVFCLFGLYIFITSLVQPNKLGTPTPPVSWAVKFSSLKAAIPTLLLPVIILGGIYIGIFTATEAAGVSVVYGLALVFLSNKNFRWKQLNAGLHEGTNLASMVIFIIIGGMLFASVASQLRIGNLVVSFVQTTGLETWAVMIVMFVILLIMGMFLPNAPIMLITVPIFFPLTKALGIDPLFLGVFYIFCGEIGLLTPPVGLNLFVMQGVTKLPLKDVTLGCLPFVGLLALSLIIICVFPELVTWLPSTM